MPNSDSDMLTIVARLTVLEHLVASMFRESVIGSGRTADDVALYAESVKSFFENKIPVGQAEITINAQVDRLFQQVVADLRSQGIPQP